MKLLLLIIPLLLCSCGGGGSRSGDSSDDLSLAGGDTTSDDRTSLAFEHPSSNLSEDDAQRHNIGDRAFGSIFVAPPATNNPGLGPLFNNNSCDGCHVKNGRGLPLFAKGSENSQAVIKISLPNGEPEQPGSPGAVPRFGTQLNDHATFGFSPEGEVLLNWKSAPGSYGDGTSFELRTPFVSLNAPGLPTKHLLQSFRTAPPVFGLGLLEAVSDSEILQREDAEDRDGDGISGRANLVWSEEKQQAVLGRFGRKASRPTLKEQAAGAYREDMGVGNPLFVDSSRGAEVDQATLDAATFYVQSIAVPRNGIERSEASRQGFQLFRSKTAEHSEPSLRFQTIHPFSDLLLHDMGTGLADGRPDFLASGNEWRTPPLWGIGITATILSRTATYLHDGRARTLEEAILWHGGEAESAKEKFRLAEKASREAILEFLRSL